MALQFFIPPKIMELEKEIHQSKKFLHEKEKAAVNLMYTSNRHSEQMNEVFRRHSISSQQYNILRILKGQYPVPVSVKTIKERMLDRMSDVSRLVERLNTKGYILRKECPEDRRNVDILISDAGLEQLDIITPEVHARIEEVINLNTEELATLNFLLDKLRG
ncbi:MAG: MarR family transcriptional regulator [Bacteroidota bacterium]